MQAYKKLLAGAVFLLGVACLFATPAGPFLQPRRYLIAPEWKIVVVDLSGRPVEGAQVQQYWDHPGLQTNLAPVVFGWFQHETKITDKEGTVSFEQRVFWGNRLMERAVEGFNRLLFGMHGGGGPASVVFAVKGCAFGSLDYTPSFKLENTLVLKRRMLTPECR